VQTILITGASSGFGRDSAETLAAQGHRVFAGLRDVADRNADVARQLKAKGITSVELDVTIDASVDAGVAQMLAATGGRLDVLINNAGIASAGVSESFSPDQLRQLFEVNVFGVQRMLRAALPTLRRQGSGLVVTIGSILGRVTFPFFGLYGASKFALEGMIDSYAYELSQLGVEFSLIQPSAYPTNMYTTIQQPADPGRAGEYGETGKIPGQMFDTFMGMFKGPNAPNPHDVAQAVMKLIATPAGQRARRVIVGTAFGADAANAAVAPVQQQVVEGLGLGGLGRVRLQGA
jgi:NAD(P)-dependent dehydrogenase (short-subunit alcohol dehydrogenase family)